MRSSCRRGPPQNTHASLLQDARGRVVRLAFRSVFNIRAEPAVGLFILYLVLCFRMEKRTAL